MRTACTTACSVPLHDDDGLARSVPGDERDLRVLPVRPLGPGGRELHARRHRGCGGHPLGVRRRGRRPSADEADRGARAPTTRAPGSNPRHSARGITPSALSTFGFVYDGVNYVGDCPTRQGAYPFCGQLLLPSYSTAKSAFGGMALMRLAQKYGPDVANETDLGPPRRGERFRLERRDDRPRPRHGDRQLRLGRLRARRVERRDARPSSTPRRTPTSCRRALLPAQGDTRHQVELPHVRHLPRDPGDGRRAEGP